MTITLLPSRSTTPPLIHPEDLIPGRLYRISDEHTRGLNTVFLAIGVDAVHEDEEIIVAVSLSGQRYVAKSSCVCLIEVTANLEFTS